MEFHVVTYNVMAPVAPPLRYSSQMERMTRIPPALAQALPVPLDAILVQESIVPQQHQRLQEGFRELGLLYESPQLQGHMLAGKLVMGGLVWFSRWPFEVVRTHMFHASACAEEDCLAAKGCVYIRVRKQQQVLHLVGFHLQAWQRPHTVAVRETQVRDIAQFVADLHIPPSEPLLYLGDWNTDYYSERLQLLRWLSLLQAQLLPLHPHSHPFSSDPGTNQLMGVDDDVAYASSFYPKGCYDQYLNTLTCWGCNRERLDYAALSTVHGACHVSSWQRIVPLKSAEPFRARLTATVERNIQDLSDHYPVWVRLHMSEGDTPTTTTRDEPSILPAAVVVTPPHPQYGLFLPHVLIGVIVTLLVILAAVLLGVGVRRWKKTSAAAASSSSSSS